MTRDSNNSSIARLEQKIDGLATKINNLSSIKEEFIEFKKSIIYISDQYDNMIKELQKTNTETKNLQKQVEQLLENNNEKDKQIKNMEEQIGNLQQYTRNQNLEIFGVPETHDENCKDIVFKIARELQVDLKCEEIDVSHRIRSAKPNTTPSIVARITTRTKRDLLIQKKALVNTNRNIPGLEIGEKIYISEHLTPQNKALLRATKIRAREYNYKFVWFKNSKILVRKSENTAVIRIFNESDVVNKILAV